MGNILDKILEEKKESLKIIKKIKNLNFLEKKIKSHNFFLNFKDKIKENKGIALISEIKKASPSAGIIVENFDHLDMKMYVESGVSYFMLTEEKYFHGLEHIQDIKVSLKYQF